MPANLDSVSTYLWAHTNDITPIHYFPSAILSRAFFHHLIHLIIHHYKHPLRLPDVPALREDDTPVVALANWRLAEKEREEKNVRNGKEKGKGEWRLAFRLLSHFRGEFGQQAVSRMIEYIA